MNITKELIVKILNDSGYTYTSPDDSDNGSKYDKYDKEGFPSIWVGNWFVEIADDALAFPWKDKTSTLDELLDFLNLSYNGDPI